MQVKRDTKNLLIRFIIVGGIGFITNLFILTVLNHSFGLNKIVSEVLAAVVALQVTFLFHDNWTYKTNTTEYDLKFWARYPSYILSNSFGSIATVFLFSIFSLIMPNAIALGFAATLAMVWNFFMNKVLIWRRHGLNN